MYTDEEKQIITKFMKDRRRLCRHTKCDNCPICGICSVVLYSDEEINAEVNGVTQWADANPVNPVKYFATH